MPNTPLTKVQELEIEAKYGFEFGNDLSEAEIEQLEAEILAEENNPELRKAHIKLKTSQDIHDFFEELKNEVILEIAEDYAKV